jgi:hypothetical protein
VVIKRGSGIVRIAVGGSEWTLGALFKRRGGSSRIDTKWKNSKYFFWILSFE